MMALYNVFKVNQAKTIKFNKQLLHICIDIENIFSILKRK